MSAHVRYISQRELFFPVVDIIAPCVERGAAALAGMLVAAYGVSGTALQHGRAQISFFLLTPDQFGATWKIAVTPHGVLALVVQTAPAAADTGQIRHEAPWLQGKGAKESCLPQARGAVKPQMEICCFCYRLATAPNEKGPHRRCEPYVLCGVPKGI